MSVSVEVPQSHENMDPSYMIEPNRVADVYRNHRQIVVPIEVEKRLDFIDISEDGHAILGSSNLSGRYWRGSVWYLKTAQLIPKKENCITGIECDSSVCDGKFVDGKKMIMVGEDSGAVTIYERTENEDQTVSFKVQNSRHDHDSCVLSISVSCDKASAVTAGMDLCIKVWDIGELTPAHTFRSAHAHHVTSVAHSNSDANLFASCSLDGAALLWDTRQPKPATVLMDNSKEGLTALAWLRGEETSLAVGSAYGNVAVLDLRTCAPRTMDNCLKQSTPLQRSVYKLLSMEPSLLAVCGDSHEVKVIDPTSENLEIRYVDERHTDFVRGLSYDKKSGKLFSCGWDTQVLTHVLQP